jgi:hypothetical protein
MPTAFPGDRDAFWQIIPFLAIPVEQRIRDKEEAKRKSHENQKPPLDRTE